MTEQNETKVTYDDRRKEMTQHLKSIQPIKINGEGDSVGEVIMERKSIFKEAGIRNTYRYLTGERTKIEQAIKQSKDILKDTKKLTPELKELEKNLKLINDFNKAEQTKSQIESQEKDLKIVIKDIRDIRTAIGSRLKL